MRGKTFIRQRTKVKQTTATALLLANNETKMYGNNNLSSNGSRSYFSSQLCCQRVKQNWRVIHQVFITVYILYTRKGGKEERETEREGGTISNGRYQESLL